MSVQRERMKKYKDSPIWSVWLCRLTMSTFDVRLDHALVCEWDAFRTRSWEDCTSQNYRILAQLRIAVRGERTAWQKLYETEVEVEARHWEKQIPALLLRRWNWSSKNWRIIYATTEESHDCESDDGSHAGFTEQSEFLDRCKRISRSWMREQLWSDPRSRPNFYSSQVPWLCHAAILDCLETHIMVRVLWGTFSKDQLLKKDCPLQSPTKQKNLASSSHEFRPDISVTASRDMKRESLCTPTQPLYSQTKSGMA